MIALGVVAAVLAVSPAASGRAAAPEAYSGLGAWVSIYDLPAWRAPERTVAALAARGVHTLFLETSNYRQRVDLVRPAGIGRFLAAAHEVGMSVVGWYLPSLADPARDARRALAAGRFRSVAGDGFDGVALDVESTVVRGIRLRNARAVALVRRVRVALGADYPLGAITIAPVGASPSYWPSFPFAGLAQSVDVFLPMEYFTARVRGAAGVRAYSAANVRIIRAQIGDPEFPVHVIGGTAPHATAAEVAAFVRAALACRVVGASLWELGAVTSGEWTALAPAIALADGDPGATEAC